MVDKGQTAVGDSRQNTGKRAWSNIHPFWNRVVVSLKYDHLDEHGYSHITDAENARKERGGKNRNETVNLRQDLDPKYNNCYCYSFGQVLIM